MKKPGLVVLDGNYFWTRELFSHCREKYDVLFLRPRDFRSMKKQEGRYRFELSPREISPGVFEQFLSMPPGWFFQLWPLASRLLANRIRKFLRGRQNNLFVSCYPYYQSLGQKLGLPILYYSIDDYTDYWPGKEEKTNRMEQACLQSSSLILCVSKYRKDLFSSQTDSTKVIHLPHGCHEKFMVNTPLKAADSLPENLQQLSRPVCGYIGALNYRFDYGFLTKVAKQLPDVQFVLGGKLPENSDGNAAWYTGVQESQLQKNIHFIGTVPHDQVGKHLQSFDVLLMPYSVSQFNTNACPMKLWDYMGTSRPVVGNTAVPEVLLWKDVIRIGETPKAFADEIRNSLADPDWMSQERLNIAHEHTWKRQSDKLLLELMKREILK